MLSPKDAFRMFDKDNKGFLDFYQFLAFIEKLSMMAGEEVPPYPIVKDLFDFCDKNKDHTIT
jgi:Ca2+-binding EF-hand superfamily protein